MEVATIYLGLMAVADAFAHYGKGIMAATVILSAVVVAHLDLS
jgi:hypothetical protein